ncbi:MAG: 7,8-dihydroneopterin aldolase/epimerase/oxygenase [Chloroflexota bacterium]|nr:7,8-dihydroneopterin aldolase/epimerase/oxygenase [Chloroflexota bacterium]
MLQNIQLDGRHGYDDDERATPQPFEVDVELLLDLRPAGVDDDLAQTVDYARVYEIVARIVGTASFRLLEAIAEAISDEILAAFPVDEVVVRVRKPAVQLGGPLDHAAVEIRRRPTAG